jgi:hypothetical protein
MKIGYELEGDENDWWKSGPALPQRSQQLLEVR